MREQVSDQWLDGFWRKGFPDQIDARPPVAEPLTGNTIDLEGEQLVAVEVGHSDTDDTTVLHVPSIGLVAAGDAVYNDVHLYLAEAGNGGIQGWLDALDTIEALQPSVVIAGHKRDGADDSPDNIEQTRRYLRDFDAALTTHRQRRRSVRRDDRALPGPHQPVRRVELRPRCQEVTAPHILRDATHRR